MLAVKVLIYKITDFNACHQTPCKRRQLELAEGFSKILYMRLDFMTQKNEKRGKIKMYQTQKQHMILLNKENRRHIVQKKDWLNYKVNIYIKFRVGNLLFRSFANRSPYRATVSDLLSLLFKKERP